MFKVIQKKTLYTTEVNCINTIRLIAAIRILYRHSVHFLCGELTPIETYITDLIDGVPIFLSISGFLIWGSIANSSSFEVYIKKRFWRIYPELWVAIFVEIMVLLFLYKEHINWFQLVIFSITQGTLFQFWTPYSLYNYGCGCPNGALWTISVLIQFYIIAFFIYKWLHGRNSIWWISVLILFSLISYLSPIFVSHMPYIIGKWYMQTVLPYLWLFLISTYVAEKKDRFIPIIKQYWYIFIAFTIFFHHFRLDINLNYYFIHSTTLFLGLLGIAYAFPKLNIKRDISYGIYIYHMTIINALITLGYSGNISYVLFVLTFSCIIAWISTITIGEWSKKKKLIIKK